MTRPTSRAALAALLAAAALAGCTHAWSDDEQAILRDLRLQGAPPAPDPTNRWADDEGAARLGQRLFFDARLSADGSVSCATCHVVDKGFQDGLPLGRGLGTTARRTMPIAGIAASQWFFWDGRKDSAWSQALGPLESAVEHGTDRTHVAHLIATHHRAEYERVFGALPDLATLPAHAGPNGAFEAWDAWTQLDDDERDAVNRVFANVGKAIAAYERKIVPGPSRFDGYVDAIVAGDVAAARGALSDDEAAGLRLFVGKARCVECHNGPLFTNDDFANTGVPEAPGLPADEGRLAGAREVLQDEFNCLGRYSDAKEGDCLALRTLHADEHTTRQFKVPSLRNVVERAPYMHAGQIATIADVITHYDRAAPAPRGETEVSPLELSARERRQLEAFLASLSSPLATDPTWLASPFDAAAQRSTP